MKKNMYSLMLSEDVIRAIDELAAEQGTNRSNLINQILAEHVSLVTPEKHVGRVFDMICSLMDGRGSYRTYAEPNNLTMSIKSVLKYHYRPTIRYEVEMARFSDEATGRIKINFRTTSSELMMELTKFFKLWMQLESVYLIPCFGCAPEYAVEPGRFRRTFRMYGDNPFTDEELSDAIAAYVAAFDEILKKYLAGEYASAEEIENEYLRYLNSGVRLI